MHEQLERELTAQLARYREQHDWMRFDEAKARDVLFKRFVHSIYEVRALRRERGEVQDRIAVFDALGEQLQRLQGDYQVRSRQCALNTASCWLIDIYSADPPAAGLQDVHRDGAL